MIGDVAPVGLCGSGLVDAVAELSARGSSTIGPLRARHSDGSAKIGEENVFNLADGVYLSQRDVRELQFAKASIATGWNLLCRDLGIAPEEIAQVLLAGSFGSYLSAASAVRIGLVPQLPLTRIVSAGNVAGEGAKIVALSVQERAAAVAIVDEVEYVELSGRTDFNDLFVDQLGSRRETRSSRAARWRCTSRDCRPPRLGRRGRALPPGLHNRPERIAPAVAEHGGIDTRSCSRTPTAAPAGRSTATGAYAARPATTCSRTSRCRAMAEQPGTYFLTDYLVRTFDRTIWRSLGLDRHPELRDDYFRHYTRVVWLAQRPTAARAEAARAAGRLGLPLEQRDVGDAGLEAALEEREEALCSSTGCRATRS